MSKSTLNPFMQARRRSLRKPPSEEILRDFTRLLSLVTGRFKPNEIDAPASDKALNFGELERSAIPAIPKTHHFQTTRLNVEHSL